MDLFGDKEKIYNIFIDYFNDVSLIKLKNENGYSIWYAKIASMLSIDDRYLVVVVENTNHAPNKIYDNVNLSKLRWTSLQTRTISNKNFYNTHKTKLQSQSIKGQNNMLSNIIINEINDVCNINEKNKKTCRKTYVCTNLPLTVELLYEDENTVYSSKGTLKSSIETYNCVITFTF